MMNVKKYINKALAAFLMLFVMIGVQVLNDGVSAYALTVGDVVTEPEDGWSAVSHEQNIETGDGFHNSGVYIYYNYNGESYVKFYFYGTKIRLTDDFDLNRNQSTEIYLDDNPAEKISACIESPDVVEQIFYEKTNLKNAMHCVYIKIPYEEYKYFAIWNIYLDEDGYISTEANNKITLDNHELNIIKGQSQALKATIEGYDYIKSNIVWSSSDENIATVDTQGNITAITEGEAVITAKIEGTDLTDTCKVTISKPEEKIVLNVEPEKKLIELGENVAADITIDNITEIAAEDIRIKYDSAKLEFSGMEESEGIKIIKSQENADELRVIAASQGKDNIVNSKKILLKLNFKGIAVGDALVDITKGRVSDGIEMEKDLSENQCGEAVITIEDYKDPNKDGAFTLLDLAIDGRYYGLNPADYPQYKTDVVENGEIDDEDLVKIGEYMLENPNYNF